MGLTLRDEVAAVLHPLICPVPSINHMVCSALCTPVATALLPLLARVRAEGEARVRERVEAVWPDPFGEFTATEAAAAKLMKDAIRAALAEEDGQ